MQSSANKIRRADATAATLLVASNHTLSRALTVAIGRNPPFEDGAARAATKWGVKDDERGGEVLHRSVAGGDSGFLHGLEVPSTAFMGLWIWLGSWVGSDETRLGQIGREKKFTVYHM